MPESEQPVVSPAVTESARAEGQMEWLQALPRLLDEVRRHWNLWVDVDAPFDSSTCSFTVPARTAGEVDAVLKLAMPHREAKGEGFALRTWDGHGAAGLLDQDRDRWALLLERVRPACPLSAEPQRVEDLILAAANICQQLWVRVPDECALESVTAVTAAWADTAEERLTRLDPPFDQGVVRRGIYQLRTLATSAADASVMVHGDLHPENLLWGGPQRGWVAIDPKPMVGDRTYDLWPLLAQLDEPGRYQRPADVLRRRAVLAADALSLPPERLCAWGLARSVESALWLLDTRGDVPAALAAMSDAVMAARAAGL